MQQYNGARQGGFKPLSAEAIRAIERRGVFQRGPKDLYYDLMGMPLLALFSLLLVYFLVVNIIFACVYTVTGGLGGTPVGDYGPFINAFFFSVQTFSTTGYGSTYPDSFDANAAATAEIILGQLNLAVVTGVLFARFSRPRPRVLFSKVMVVRDIAGVQTLMFRVANEQRNAISEAHMSAGMTIEERDPEGVATLRLLPLALDYDTTPLFVLGWVISHRITPESPLWGMNTNSLLEAGSVIVCSLSGTDDLLNTSVNARHVYGGEDIRFDHRFVDVSIRSPAGDLSIDYPRFHDTLPVQNHKLDKPDAC